MNAKKQIFRKLSKTNLSGLKSHLKVIIDHNVCTYLDLATSIFNIFLSLLFL